MHTLLGVYDVLWW